MAPVPESKGVKWVPIEQHGMGTIAESTSQINEIHEFIKGNVDIGGVKKETSVEKLRRIIPILIMDNFNVREEPCQKKVKGIWNEKPQGWPGDIPFCDPNNTIKGGNGKPKKKLLIQMCNFLVNKFLEANNYQFLVEDIKPSIELLNQHTLPNKSEQTSLGAPSEVSAEEDDSMDPAVENLERLRKKWMYIVNKGYLSKDDTKLIEQTLDKLGLITVKRCAVFLQTCHDLELTLDLAVYEKKMSDSHREKWQKLTFEVEENIETSVVPGPLDEAFTWEDLGIQEVEQISWDALQSNGQLDVRTVSKDESETPEYNTKEMTEDEKATAKLEQFLPPDTLLACMSPQKADVPTVLEVPYGNQSEANWPTSYPFDNGLDQQQAENQHMRSLLMDRTGNEFTEQDLPQNGLNCEWNESDIVKIVMDIEETSKRTEERTTVDNQVSVYQYNGGDGMDMEVDIPLPTSLTVKEIFDTGPLA